MKIIEVLKFNRELIKRLKTAGIRLEDEAYVDLYTDYTTLIGRGEKVSYIVAHLSDKYAVSERKVYDIIKRFSKRLQNACSMTCSRFSLDSTNSANFAMQNK